MLPKSWLPSGNCGGIVMQFKPHFQPDCCASKNRCGADGLKLDGKLTQITRYQQRCSRNVSNGGSFTVGVSFYLCVSIFIFHNFLNKRILYRMSSRKQDRTPFPTSFCLRIAEPKKKGSFKSNATKVDLCSDLH